METPQQILTATTKDSLVMGVSRSGRVRKKSSKLLDFQSPDEFDKKPTKRASKSGRFGTGRGGRLLSTHARGRKVFNESDDDVDDDDDAADMNNVDEDDLDLQSDIDGNGMVHLDGDLPIGDSEDELDELVADLVEGVAAESMEQTDNIDTKVRQSLYMTEKANKRKILKDGKVVTGKLERKDKGKSRYTAYSMWAREFRKTSKFSKNQDLDFSNAARRLGELWANVSNKEKSAWRRKAKIQAVKAKAREKVAERAAISAGTNANSSFFNRATTSRTKKLAAERRTTPPPLEATLSLQQSQQFTTKAGLNKNGLDHIIPPGTKRKRNNSHKSSSDLLLNIYPSATHSNTNATSLTIATSSSSTSTLPFVASSSSHVTPKKSQLPNIEVVDAAAHLKLLGESLTIIGERLKEHEGQIAVSGSLSVLLDSLLCSLGPLLCLTTRIPGLEKKPKLSENLAATLDNIAYVMPGL